MYQEESKIASDYNYKNCLSGVLMTVADTLSWKFSRRFWAKDYDGVLTNSEVCHAFVPKQFISMDRPPLVIFTANLKLHATLIARGIFSDLFLRCVTTLPWIITVSHVACFIFRQCVCVHYNAHALILKFASCFVFLRHASRVCITWHTAHIWQYTLD
jgi:hypothetical protein